MKYLLYKLLTFTVLLSSCSKNIPLTPGINDFKVQVKSATYKVNEEVEFELEGNPDMISFYSGELYKDYDYRDGRIIKLDEAILSFTSSRPTVSNRQPDQLSVWVSTDFNGDYSDFSSVKAATWHDVTERFTLSTVVAFSPSGNADISDLFNGSESLYVAFKYISRPQAEFGVIATWNIQSFLLTGNSVVGPVSLGTMANANWKYVEEKPLTPSRSTMTAARLILLGQLPTVDFGASAEVWAISRKMEVGDINSGPDKPVIIKNNEGQRLNSFSHIYSTPGVYKVTFIATNANVNDSQQVLRELEVTIVE